MSDRLTAYLDQIGERYEAASGAWPAGSPVPDESFVEFFAHAGTDLPRLLRIARAAVELSNYGSPVEEREGWAALHDAIKATEKELDQ